jgi:hypothetical protein
MKIIIKFSLILFCFFLLYSCSSSGINGEIKKYSKDMIKNPKKLFDIKKNYPEIYNDDIISDSLKKEEYIKELSDFIIDKEIIDYDDVFGYELTIDKYFEMTKDMLKIGNKSDFYEFTIRRFNGGVRFLYLIKNDESFLFNILPFTLFQ